jgi:hypothetical protein
MLACVQEVVSVSLVGLHSSVFVGQNGPIFMKR